MAGFHDSVYIFIGNYRAPECELELQEEESDKL